jgi:ribosomal protein S18 acetylase RimI-like enzyme
MVFWKSMPIDYIWKLYNNNDTFQSLIFDKDDIILKCSDQYTVSFININNINNINIYKLEQVSTFLRNYFKKSTNSPILDIPPNELIDKNINSFIITVESNESNQSNDMIIGCIRYKYIGNFATTLNRIYSIDCFCIHPQWRKKGIGDMLLTTLHKYVNKNDIPHNIFLKEGNKLGIIHQPTYSGTYIYREIKYYKTNDIQKINPTRAHKIVTYFQELSNNSLFVIFNPNNTKNQEWYLYINPQNNLEKILVCFQNTYQYFSTDISTDNNKTRNKIAWGTAWFETNISDETRKNAINQFISCLYTRYKYVWMNKAWIDDTTEWKYDGDFHWYLYQWNTSLTIKRNYCIIL